MSYDKIRMMLLTATIALLEGCGTVEDMSDRRGEGQVPILLTTSIDGSRASTRATDGIQSTQLDADQTFNVWFEGDGATTVTSLVYTADGSGGVTTTTQPYFTFDGTTTTVHAYYPPTVNATSPSTFSVKPYMNNDNYMASDLMYAETTLTKSGTAVAGTLTFRHRLAKIIVDVTGGDNIGVIQSIRIVGGYRTVNITDNATLTLGTTLTDANSASGTYITVFADEGRNLTKVENRCALIPPQTINGNFLQVVTDKGTVNYTLSNKTFEGGKSYVIHLTVTAVAISAGTVTLDNWMAGWREELYNYGSDHIISEEVQPVEMTFAEDLEWSNMNLGASTETDYGIYFAWGETQGFTGDGRVYFPEQYLLGNGGTKETLKYTKYHAGLSAYVADGYEMDNYTALQAEDDAVSVMWGNGWRMPTKAELESLLATGNDTEHYEWIWHPKTPGYKNSGHAGYELHEKATDKSMFFPASGYLGASGWGLVDEDALYWTASMGEYDSFTDLDGKKQTGPWPRYAYYMRLHESYVENGETKYHTPYVRNDANRYVGLTVRPVRTILVPTP